MFSLTDSLLIFMIPLGALILPGIIISSPQEATFLQSAARHILWSVSILIIASFSFAYLGLPLHLLAFILLATTVLILSSKVKKINQPFTLLPHAIFVAVFLLVFLSFSIPYLSFHDGLPTGDSQKAILWAQQILSSGNLPDYSIAQTLLNRDPVDFYTPGLHALTALLMSLSPEPLATVGFFSIGIAIALALIGASIASYLMPKNKTAVLITLFYIFTHIRFLRYVREPGYHYQNLLGELLLFGIIFIALSLIKKANWRDTILIILLMASLVITHQFSAFIAIFTLAPIAIVFLLKHRKSLTTYLQKRKYSSIFFLLILTLFALASLNIGLQEKIPHIFTNQPHLISLTPSLTDYLNLMGNTWFLLGAGGFLLAIITSSKLRSDNKYILLAFTSSTLILLALTQGPRLFIDIPPVRALLYLVIPFSIYSAFFINRILHKLSSLPQLDRLSTVPILLLLIITPQINSVANAYDLSHTVRTNSTLLGEYTYLIDTISKNIDGAVLIDDYNRRSASWLVLSGKPMFTRIASDLSRQMQEAKQSQTRRDLYLKQLDYEKIFALGSRPEIISLMNKHDISYITGIQKSSNTSFSHNPNLSLKAVGKDIFLYMPLKYEKNISSDYTWLLNSSTLANDIGDREDTFKHLPASVRATRLSDPKNDGSSTFRETTAPLIPLIFNVGDYTDILWDRDDSGTPDASLQLYIKTHNQSKTLTVITSTGTKYQLSKDGTVEIEANDIPIPENGLIKILINNPSESLIKLDIIALGLSNAK